MDLHVSRTPVAEIVGRDHELAELDRYLARATAGQGAVCLLTGEAGVGKTAVARAFAARAREEARVLWGTSWAAGAAPAYWPWRQALRALLDDDRPDLTALGHAAGQVARLLPELSAEPCTEPEPERSRFALFDGVAGLLTAAARRRPLVVVLDDLHDADEPSVALLGFLGRALAAVPAVFVGTARDDDTGLPGDLATRLGRDVHRLPLRGLGLDEVADLVAIHAPGATESFVAALRDRTGGNPFFIEELLALAGGAPEPGVVAELPVPRAVRDVIRARLAPLPSDSAELLGTASVIGVEFELGTLAAAAGLDAADAIVLLESPRAHGLVVDAAGGRRFAFTHALVRDAVYQALPVRRRMAIHRAVGEALEGRLGHPDAPPLAELAHHFRHAMPLSPAGPARDYAQRAAEGAMTVSAWEDAERHFAAALELHCQLPMDEERRCELLLGLGCARARAGRPDDARDTLIEAASVAGPLDAARRFAVAAIEIGAVGLPPDDEDAVAVQLLEQALRMLDKRPSALRARVLARLAVQLYWQEDRSRISELVDEAARIAATLDDPTAKLEVLAQVHLATSGPETPERLGTLGRLLDLAARGPDPEAELQVRIWRVAALIQLGDLRSAAAELEAFARLSARVQQSRWEWYVPQLRGLRALIEGRLDEAEELGRRALEMGAKAEASMAPQLFGALLVSIRWTQRRLDELLDLVTFQADAHPARPGWLCARAAALVDAGRREEARVEVERLVGPDSVSLRRDATFLSSCALLADAVARLGDAAAARTVYDALAPYAGHNATLPSGGFLGPVARHMGVLAAAYGDAERAREHLAEARRIAERGHMGAMLDWIAADEESLRAAVPGPPEPVASATEPLEGLLRREGDVWTVSASGRTTRLHHAKGLTYLAMLLARPGAELHALELARSGLAGAPPPAGDLGPLLDRQAKAEFRARVDTLRAEIDEAEAFNDFERAARAREELEALLHELRVSTGLGGRDRRPGSDAEKARINVKRAITSVLDRLGERDGDLAEELRNSVRTGAFCAYRPSVRQPRRWRVEDP
jgi:tetratricopeptide (TPR) repeat protein